MSSVLVTENCSCVKYHKLSWYFFKLIFIEEILFKISQWLLLFFTILSRKSHSVPSTKGTNAQSFLFVVFFYLNHKKASNSNQIINLKYWHFYQIFLDILFLHCVRNFGLSCIWDKKMASLPFLLDITIIFFMFCLLYV